jgi:penicillin-binding protein 1A
MGVIPNVITKITSKDGTQLYEASDAGPGRVVDPNVLAEMNDMLKTAVEVGTGKGANLGGWDFGGKTGTSQNARDALFVGYTSAMVTGVWLGNDNDSKTTLSGGNVPAAIWSEFMTKAHAGRSPVAIPGGSYQGQLIAQQLIDPATGQALIDPTTGQPQVQYVDGGTGQPVQTMIDPATGQTVAIDPATGLANPNLAPVGGGGSTNPPIQTGQMTDPTTGLPINGGFDQTQPQQYDAQGQAIDPVTGFPLQADPNAGLSNAPIDPQTGMPMVLVVDPATGQQVWVPSTPAAGQQQFQGQQIQPTSPFAPPAAVGQEQQPVYQNENSQRTLMDLLFGN